MYALLTGSDRKVLIAKRGSDVERVVDDFCYEVLQHMRETARRLDYGDEVTFRLTLQGPADSAV